MAVGFVVVAHPVFAFYGQDFDTINKILLEQESLNQKVDSKIVEDQTIEKLIKSVEIKNSVIDEKENAYDKAINELKLWVVFFGVLLLLVSMAFGIVEDRKLTNKKKELSDELKEKKKELFDELIVKKEELKKLYEEEVERLNIAHEKSEKESSVKRKDELLIVQINLEDSIKEQISRIWAESKSDVDAYIRSQENRKTTIKEIYEETPCHEAKISELDSIVNKEEVEF
jgi:hypothetical protein